MVYLVVLRQRECLGNNSIFSESKVAAFSLEEKAKELCDYLNPTFNGKYIYRESSDVADIELDHDFDTENPDSFSFLKWVKID